MGARAAVTVLACSVVLSGCTNARSEPTSASTDSGRTAVSETASPAALEPVGADSPLVQHLWRPVESLTPLRTNLPPRLDFEAIRRAPRLTGSTIGRAVLAVGTEPGPYDVGDPAVVSAAGEWRVIERDVLGMRNPGIVEQQFELSPDGSLLALGDEYGIVFLDLTTGEPTRVRVDLQDPVIHAWTGTGDGVLITRRGYASEAWEVRVDDGSVSPVPFSPWSSSVRRDGSVAELSGSIAGSFTDVRTWEAGQVTATQALRTGIPRQASVANEGDDRVGFRQDRRRRTGATGGFGVLDPHTGEVVGFLALPPEPLAWVSQQGLVGRWIVLNVSYGNGGGIVAWDPVGQRLRAVTRIDDRAANISLARDLIG